MKRQVLWFVGHYVEMVLAMLVGMLVLTLPWMVIWPGLSDQPVLGTAVMVANMTVGMAAWMSLRRHGTRMIVEMSAAMVAPFVVLLVPLAAGAITADALSAAGHGLMFITMLAAMLLRRDHYTRRNGVRAGPAQPGRSVETVAGPDVHDLALPSAPIGEDNCDDNEGMKVHESINYGGR